MPKMQQQQRIMKIENVNDLIKALEMIENYSRALKNIVKELAKDSIREEEFKTEFKSGGVISARICNECGQALSLFSTESVTGGERCINKDCPSNINKP